LFVLALKLSNLLKVTGFGLLPGGNLLLITFCPGPQRSVLKRCLFGFVCIKR
jgi:hypothetical protein